MPIPMLDLRAQLKPLESQIKRAVNEVIESGCYALGPKVEELEAKMAEYLGVEHGIGVASGSDALLISLMALDVGPGDVVVTTPYTFFGTAGVIARLHATPAFVDIHPDTYNMDPQALRRWFERETEKRDKVKAIIPVHIYGQCADMDAILDVARQYNVPVIEDAAQAIGARYPSKSGIRKAGAMGTLGCFSFYPTKNLSGMGDGGIVVTNDGELAQKVRWLRNHGQTSQYYHAMVGGNFRLDPIQAAVLLVKLPHVDKWNAKRQQNAAYYDEHLNVKAIASPAIAYERAHHVYHLYVISVADRRDELKHFLTENQIANGVYYAIPLHQQPCFAYLGYRLGDFPCSERAAGNTLCLPIYPELTTAMQSEVIQVIETFYTSR